MAKRIRTMNRNEFSRLCVEFTETAKHLPFYLSDLAYDGGIFVLMIPTAWTVSDEDINAAKRYIKSEHDVVHLYTERVQFV